MAGLDGSLREHQATALRTLQRWIDGNRDILEGLVALRSLGENGEAAVKAVLQVPSVAIIALSLVLWTIATAREGDDPDQVLQLQLTFCDIDLLKRALFGVEDPCFFAESLHQQIRGSTF